MVANGIPFVIHAKQDTDNSEIPQSIQDSPIIPTENNTAASNPRGAKQNEATIPNSNIQIMQNSPSSNPPRPIDFNTAKGLLIARIDFVEAALRRGDAAIRAEGEESRKRKFSSVAS